MIPGSFQKQTYFVHIFHILLWCIIHKYWNANCNMHLLIVSFQLSWTIVSFKYIQHSLKNITYIFKLLLKTRIHLAKHMIRSRTCPVFIWRWKKKGKFMEKECYWKNKGKCQATGKRGVNGKMKLKERVGRNIEKILIKLGLWKRKKKCRNCWEYCMVCRQKVKLEQVASIRDGRRSHTVTVFYFTTNPSLHKTLWNIYLFHNRV